ncbi:MAG: glutaminyl-peptide cyclotransferase [Gammaproteobacteria bacterium]
MLHSRKARAAIGTLLVAGIIVLTAWAQFAANGETELWTYEIVATIPHEPTAFTQGLVIHDGRLYESTGQYGESTLRRLELATGRVEKQIALSSAYFGEGITIFGERLYQLTWQNNLALVYDVETFDRVGAYRYDGEGWGLTHDGTHLIVSDGSAAIRFHNPETFEVVRRLVVLADGQPVGSLNELEYINGEIWANLWYQDRIARISPETGAVLGWIDLSGLYPRSRRASEDVLNGIAYDAETDRLYVTGKNWPWLYQIAVVQP